LKRGADIDLAMMERDGVEVNFCPQCRGVWVDRFQLNKIVERGLDAQLEQLRRQKEDR
jgi:Zn-finger nucleic acid-binding protein